MFRKGKDDKGGPAPGQRAEGERDEDMDAPPLKPFSRKGSHIPAKPAAGAMRPEIPRRTVDIPGPGRRVDPGRMGEDAKRLTVGRDIRLSGEITQCDKLVVEGHVEASLTGARAVEVAASGYFKGDAEVEEADVSGRYEGTLVARDKLTVRAGGRISGTIRYGKIVIEAGGEVSGDMRALNEAEAGQAAPPSADAATNAGPADPERD